MCCVALPCLFVCLTLLASFFLPSHLLLKHIEKEERKKQARSNKQTRQSNTAHPRQSLFLEKNELLRVRLEPTTLYTLDRALYQLSCLGWLGPNLTSHSTPDEQANHQLSMKEKAGVMKPPMTPNTKTSIYMYMYTYMFLNER